MDLDPSRLRRGEWLAGAGALVLLASLFALPWYAVKAPYRPTASLLGVATSPNGWHSLTQVRWLLALTILAALALGYLQATRRAPALPVTFSMIVTVLALAAVLVLIYRVLINEPGADSVVDQRAGAYLGLISACVIVYGGYASLREEGIAERDGPGEIETVTPGGAAAS
jgi:hypothetical protein